MKKTLRVALVAVLALMVATTVGACKSKEKEEVVQAAVQEYVGTLLTAYQRQIVLSGDQGDLEFATSDDTIYDTGELETMYLDDIVSVAYHEDADGKHADKVTLVEHFEEALDFAGELSEVGDDTITLTDDSLTITFQIDEDTYIVGDLSKGDKIELTYLGDLNEYPYANVVAVVEEVEQVQTNTIHGIVSELSQGTVLIAIDSAHAYRFVVADTTEVSGADKTLAVGDHVDLSYEGRIESQPTAKSIKIVHRDESRAYVINGTVATADNGSVTIDTGKAQYAFVTNANTRFYGEKPAKGYRTEITYTGQLGNKPEATIVYCAKSAKDANKATAKKTDDAKKKAEEAKKADEAKKQEEAKKAEEAKKQEEAKKAEEAKKQEEAKKAEEDIQTQPAEPEQIVPAPEQQAEPEPEPEPAPAPEQQAEPEPEPAPAPEQQAEPEPAPEQQAEPEPAPEQQAEPEPEPTPEQQAEPAPNQQAEPESTESEQKSETTPEVGKTNPDMGVSGQGTIVKGDEEKKTVDIEIKGKTITLKYDKDTKISSGYIPQKGDVVKVEYGSTSLMLKDIQLVSRPATTDAKTDTEKASETPAPDTNAESKEASES